MLKKINVCMRQQLQERNPSIYRRFWQNGDQGPVVGAVTLAEVVHRSGDDIRAEAGGVWCRIELSESQKIHLATHFPRYGHKKTPQTEKGRRLSGTAWPTLPNEAFQASTVCFNSARLTQSHEQLHHDVGQVTVDQAVNLLWTHSQSRSQSAWPDFFTQQTLFLSWIRF